MKPRAKSKFPSIVTLMAALRVCNASPDIYFEDVWLRIDNEGWELTKARPRIGLCASVCVAGRKSKTFNTKAAAKLLLTQCRDQDKITKP